MTWPQTHPEQQRHAHKGTQTLGEKPSMVRNNPRNRNSETELFIRGPSPFIQNMHPGPAQDTDLLTHTPASRIREAPLAPRESQKQRHDGYPFTHMYTHTRTPTAETHKAAHTRTKRKSHPSFPPLARSWCLWPPRSLYHACDVPDITWQVGEHLIQKKQKMPHPHPRPKCQHIGLSMCGQLGPTSCLWEGDRDGAWLQPH